MSDRQPQSQESSKNKTVILTSLVSEHASTPAAYPCQSTCAAGYKRNISSISAVLGLSCASVVKRAAQNPGVWSALDALRGKARLGVEEIRALLINSVPGQDYPNLATIPEGNFDCNSVKPGFYADIDTRCQVIRRCDVNGNQTAYLCPNLTIFNQITLVCQWFWDVDCSKAKQFYDYSNSRLYQDVPLLDNEDSYVAPDIAQAVVPAQPKQPAPPKPNKTKAKKQQ